MPAWLLDLIAWTVCFAFLFFLFRYLQKRKRDKND